MAYGLNYGTVKNQLSKAESKLPNNESLSGRSLKGGAKQLVLKFDDAEKRADIVDWLREVLKAAGVETDDWTQALMYLLDFWHEHTTGAAA